MRVLSLDPQSDRDSFPSGYTLKQAAGLCRLSESKIRSFIQAGFLEPRRGERGAYRFSFQDLVLLRTAKELSEEVSPRKLKKALAGLRDQLPRGKQLSSVRIYHEGESLVVQDGAEVWNPESGQTLLNFDVGELALEVAPIVHEAAQAAMASDALLTGEDWYELACDLEASDEAAARDAYKRALELDPSLAEAHINLGRLLHEADDLSTAEDHYRAAVTELPKDPVAAYDLAVVLHDQGRIHEARQAYYQALACDPDYADAHYNLAQLYQHAGMPKMAERHLRTYRRLTGVKSD